LFGDFGELIVEFFNRLADDAGVADIGHKIGVAFPAGDKMQMYMIGQAGAGTAAVLSTIPDPGSGRPTPNFLPSM